MQLRAARSLVFNTEITEEDEVTEKKASPRATARIPPAAKPQRPEPPAPETRARPPCFSVISSSSETSVLNRRLRRCHAAGAGRSDRGHHPRSRPCASGQFSQNSLGESSRRGNALQSQSAKDAKYNFGRLIDLARAEPVVVEKHGRPVVVVLAIEEYQRLVAIEAAHAPDAAAAANVSGKSHD